MGATEITVASKHAGATKKAATRKTAARTTSSRTSARRRALCAILKQSIAQM